jgi:hypothetical protein
MGSVMGIDVAEISSRLATQRHVTDYEVWRGLKQIESELYACEREGRPIPFELARLRAQLLRRRQPSYR